MTWMIFLSMMMFLSSSSPMMMWFFMEMNTLSMSLFISKEMKTKNKKNSMNLMFICIQCLSSIMTVSMMMFTEKWTNMNSLLLMLTIFMKMGMWPFHLWYLKLLSNIEMNYSMVLLSSWQKMIPVFLIKWMILSNSHHNLLTTLIIFITLSAFISSMMLNKKSSFKILMILSSINNMSWMVMCIFSNPLMTIVFILMYMYSMNLLFEILPKNSNPFNFSDKKQTMMMLINIGGVPPMPLFFMKMMIIMNCLISKTFPTELMMIMIMVSYLFMFFYCKKMLFMITENPLKNQITKVSKNNKILYLWIFLLYIPIMMIF